VKRKEAFLKGYLEVEKKIRYITASVKPCPESMTNGFTNTIFKCIILLTVLSVMSCAYSEKASSRLLKEAEQSAPFDVIIVPGVPFKDGRWDTIMKGRVYWSKYLYDHGITKNIIYSGSAVYSPYYEAEIMALYAGALGIPSKHIFTETKAEHSTENLYYGYKKAQQLGFKKVALASDPFQSKLLRSYARRRVSTAIQFIPFVVDTLKKMQPAMTDPQIPYSKAFKENFISITQRDSFWKRLKGTIRGNIDTTAYEENQPSLHN